MHAFKIVEKYVIIERERRHVNNKYFFLSKLNVLFAAIKIVLTFKSLFCLPQFINLRNLKEIKISTKPPPKFISVSINEKKINLKKS